MEQTEQWRDILFTAHLSTNRDLCMALYHLPSLRRDRLFGNCKAIDATDPRNLNQRTLRGKTCSKTRRLQHYNTARQQPTCHPTSSNVVI